MDDRTALVLAWLEGEGERQRRPILPPPQSRDPALRGWVQAGVCAVGGALAAALFVCWLVQGWHQAARMTFTEELRLEWFLRTAGDPSRPARTPAWWKAGGETTRNNDGAFGVLLCVRMFALGLGTIIGAVFLCAACALYNTLVGGKGSPNSVPELLFGKAMGIMFVTALVNAVAVSAIGLLVGAGGTKAGVGERGAAILAQLLCLPVSILVLARMNCVLLPTTFGRGFLVAMCYLMVGFFVVIVLAVVVAGLFLVVSHLR